MKMPPLFKDVHTFNDIANLLKIDSTKLEDIIYKRPHNQRYIKFNIVKRKGALRIIYSPKTDLKSIQKNLASSVTQFLVEHNLIRVPVHGFIPQRSIASNAKLHIGKRFILNVDLQDFFPSINFGRIYGLFMSFPFRAIRPIASILAQICCHENMLPQGAPTSPILSNMICCRMDGKLQQLAKKHYMTYSRYVDDITFSKTSGTFPPSVAVYDEKGKCDPGEELLSIIQSNGFQINQNKIHLYRNTFRQSVTGLVVNKKLNIDRRFIKELRAIIHDCQKNGPECAYKNHHPNYKHLHRRANSKDGYKRPDIFSVIEGKFNFLSSIRGIDDPIRRSLQKKYCEINSDYKEVMIKENALLRKKFFFISHASEDKESIAKPLADSLIARGIPTWLDKYQITIGDSLVQKINEGLSESKFGIVILSSHFFNKDWTMKELESLYASEMAGMGKRILPLFHKIDHKVVCMRFPLISPRYAWNTAEYSIEELTAKFELFFKENLNGI